MEGVYISIFLCWRRPGWLGSVNSSSSMGAPFSTMNATRTPSDGLLGGDQDFAANTLTILAF